MIWYVIYTVDCPRKESISQFRPKGCQWQLTEDDSQYDYGYLGGEWTKGKHRKWVAQLTEEQFDQWLTQLDMEPEQTQTMGSITELGWLPAVSFRSGLEENHQVIMSAYVSLLATRAELLKLLCEWGFTPPQVLSDDPAQRKLWKDWEDSDESVWNAVREIILMKYDQGFIHEPEECLETVAAV